MTNRSAVQAIAVGTLLVAGLVAVEVRLFFPRVEVARNTTTITHGEPQPAQCPVVKKSGGHGGGGTILVGG